MRAPLAASDASHMLIAHALEGLLASIVSLLSVLPLLGLIALLSLSLRRPAAHLASGAVGR
jgi:hypothetical protein